MDAEAEVERPGALTSTNTVGSPRKLKKVRKKRAPAVSLDGRPETLHPEALDERLDQLLSKKHQELWQKLETWMRRQEELILSIDNKILWPGQSYGSLADLETVHEDAEPGIPDISEVAKKALKTQKTDATFSSTVSPSSGEGSGSAKMKMKAAVWNVSTKSKEPQKQKNRLRNSREVQDFYMQRRIMEMKKTRKNPMGPPETFRDRLTDIMTNAMFEMGMMCLCLLSAVVVGIEVNWFAQNLSASSPPLAFTIINHTISVIFAMELAMKVYVLRFRFFFVDVGWHLLDMLVVGTGLVELAIDLVGMVNTCPRDAFSSDCSESGVDLSILRALRVARAVRLARLARLVQYIRELRRLIISVAATLKSVFWTIVLLAMIIYTFAVIFQQAVNDHEQSLLQQNLSSQSDLEKFFPGLLRTAMTLLQTATGGVSWIEVESTISGISSLLVVLFLCYFSFIYFAVLNVVTGVFCSSAIESASQDAEAQIDEHVRKSKDYSERLKSLFTQIDTDGTGTIGILEFEEMWEDPGLQALLSTLGINQSKAWKLFEIMDEDNNGEINAEEFVSTCFKLQGSAQRVDTERIYAGLKRVGAAIEELGGVLTDILQTVGFLKNTFELRRPPQAAVPRSATSPLRKATTMT